MVDIHMLNGILTLILLIVFIGIFFWAYSSKRKEAFDQASRLPLEDNDGIKSTEKSGSKS